MDESIKVLEQFFLEENAKLQDIEKLDLNQDRIVKSFTQYLEKKRSEIFSEKEAEVLLNKLIVEFNNLPKVLVSLVSEINATRREQFSRVTSIKDSHDKLFVLKEKARVDSEDQKEVIEQIKKGENPERPRKIGTRPKKLKNIRNAKKKHEEIEKTKE